MSDVTSTMAREDDADDARADAALVLSWAPTWRSMERGLRITGKSHAIGRELVPGGYAIPHSATSRVHAVVHRDGSTVRIKDAGSRNGTFVNDVAVAERELVRGDRVRIGDALLVFREAHGAEHVSFALDGSTPNGIQGMVGGWSARRVALDVAAAARTDLAVVVRGETGTGKELCARALHAAFGRRGPFVAVNCAALSPTLFESELFGHEKGAFTGADRRHQGLARAANGGTLFLDEIGDLGLDAQAKLLRVLESHEVLAVGSTRPVAVDLRVVSATHRDLSSLVAAGRFRADLFARIAGATIELSPLRERAEDLYMLVRHFLARARSKAEPSFGFMQALLAHAWPYNVRELANAVTRASSLANDGELRASHLALEATEPRDAPSSRETPGPKPRRKGPTRDELVSLCRRHAGNVAAVARSLERDPAQVYRWLKQYDVDPSDFRA